MGDGGGYSVAVMRGPELAASGWVEALLALERESMAPLLAVTGGAFPEARRRAGLVADDATVVVVQRGGAAVAAVHFARDWNDPADLYVASGLVAPAARRGPALRLLLVTALGAVRRLKWRRLTTNVHPRNHAALALAGRLGFRRVPAPGRASIELALERAALDDSPFARRTARRSRSPWWRRATR